MLMYLDKQIPTIDLHGMDREYAIFKVKEFIRDCYQIGYRQLVIIHGRGQGILQQAVSKYLKTDKHVLKYKLDFMNPGCTLVELRVSLDKTG